MQFGIRITADGKVAAGGAREVARSFDEITKSSGAAAAAASSAYDMFGMKRPLPMAGQLKEIEQVSKQTAFAMRQLPMQMTDIVTGLASGQSPLMVLMQQGGQLKDVFGGIGPAVSAITGYVAGMINPFTVAAGAAAALGYGMYKALHQPVEPAKDLKTAVGDLGAAVSDVGKVARDISMDSLYKEFNKAGAGAREAMIEQIKFQQTMLATQGMLAQKSLAKTLEDVGQYSFADKLKGAFAGSGAEKLSKELGVSVDAARDMLPAIRELRKDTGDAGNFMARFGTELAKSSKGAAQDLLKDIKAVADGSRDAAAAQSRLSEATKKMRDAGSRGQIALPEKNSKGDGTDDFARQQAKEYVTLYESALKYVDTVNLQEQAGHKLTEGERILALAKSHLTEAQYREVEALVAGTAGRERQRIDTEAYAASLRSLYGPLEERMRQEERATDLYGKTAAQIEELQLARLREARAIAAANGAAPEAIEFYDRMIDMQGRLADAMNKRQALDGQVDMWKSIEGAAHDTWNSIGRDGGNTFDQLKRSLRSGIYDLLYQMTMKKWIISISTLVSGEGVAGNAFGSAVSGSLGKLFDKALVDQFGIGGFSKAELATANAGFYDNATGGVYSSPDLHAYANTVVTKPTLFNFAQGAAIGRMGEKPGSPGEAIMPLTRIGGDLGVKVDMGGAASQQMVFAPSYQIDARGADLGVEAKIRRALVESEDRTKAWMMSSLNRGGALAYATGRRR